MPMAGDVPARLMSWFSQLSVTTVSLLSSTRYSPRARRIASFTVSAMPRSVGVRTTSTRSCRADLRPARYSAVPSSEPISMKTSSNGGRLCLSTLGTHSFVYSSMPQQGIRIDTSPGGDSTEIGLSGTGCERGPLSVPAMRFSAMPCPFSRSGALKPKPRSLLTVLANRVGVFRRLRLILCVLLGVLADQIDEQQVLLLVADGELGEYSALFLQEPLAILAGFVERQGLGDDPQRGREVLLAREYPRQVVAGPHVGRVHFEGLAVRRS